MEKAFVVTGPTSGIGRGTALHLARHGTVVLVGRDAGRLAHVELEINSTGGKAISVVCDLAEPESVKRAAAEVIALKLPLVALLNNAGIRYEVPSKNSRGWDMAFATNHLGPFALTEALVPHLPDGAGVVFICSAVEDPERGPAKAAGFRGARYISAEACARGEWRPGGSTKAGFDAYATSKQCNLATVLALAKENPRVRFLAVEPGFIPNTGLGRDAPAVLRWIASALAPLIVRLVPHSSTPERAAKLVSDIVLDEHAKTGTYFDDVGKPMQGSAEVVEPAFHDRVVEETRKLIWGA